MLTFEYPSHKDICNPKLSLNCVPKRMFKFKVWLCKAIGDVHSAADESVKLRFYKQTKKKNISEQNNHTNNYLPDWDNFT